MAYTLVYDGETNMSYSVKCLRLLVALISGYIGNKRLSKHIPLLSNCRSEYDGAVALARTNFENARARRDIPRFDDVDAMLKLCAIFTFEITAVHAGDCVDVKIVGYHFVSL